MARLASALSNYKKRNPKGWADAQRITVSNRPGIRNSIQDGATRALAGYKSSPVAAPSASAPSPAASAPAGGLDYNTLPVDPAYDAQVASLGRSRDDSLAGLQGDRQRALLDFGYNAQTDADGNVTALSFDASNPYSRAAQLQKRYQESKTGTQNAMAARGQLYSGARINAQNANDTSYSMGENALQKMLGEFLARNLQDQRNARNAFDAGSGQAMSDRLGRLPQNPLYNPAASTTTATVPSKDLPSVKPVATRSRKQATTGKKKRR